MLSRKFNQQDVKYVGHHYVADALWMSHWLGLDVLQKCYMDTEFAQQTIDEASELKSERGISMKYTTLGRYDIDLILWKKANKALCEDGYGYISSTTAVTIFAVGTPSARLTAIRHAFARSLLSASFVKGRDWDSPAGKIGTP